MKRYVRTTSHRWLYKVVRFEQFNQRVIFPSRIFSFNRKQMSKNWISQEIKQSSGKSFAEFVSFMFAIPYSPYIYTVFFKTPVWEPLM